MKVINRIKDSQEFVFTVRKGHVLKHNPFLIHYINNDKNVCRIGISVSKKIGNAVTTLVEYTSHTFDIVIIIKADFLDNSFDDNKNILNKLLSKIGITK